MNVGDKDYITFVTYIRSHFVKKYLFLERSAIHLTVSQEKTANKRNTMPTKRLGSVRQTFRFLFATASGALTERRG